jgi:rod shape-determining protein MreB
VAVISLGGIVAARSLRIAGDELNEDIIQFARDEYNLMLGERTAEDIKIKIGSAYPLEKKLNATMRGRDLVTGLPKAVVVDSDQIRQALSKSVATIVDSIKMTVEETPPELVADIMDKGITLAGGGALLRGLDRLVSFSTKMPVHIADDPLTCVVRGAGLVLEDIDKLKGVLVATQHEKSPRL